VGWPATDEADAGKGRRRTAVAALVAAMLLSVGVGVGLGWERSPAESSPSDDQGGGPVVAGAATSTAPTSTPTTAAPSTSTSTSTSVTTSTTTPPPAAPPSLTVSPARVDLGSAGTSATLTVRNGGDEPLSWAADPSTPWLRVHPSSGRLDGGEQARLSLSATRDGLPEGDADARVELTWGGAARSVAVALRVEHPSRDQRPGGLASPDRRRPLRSHHHPGRRHRDRRVGPLVGDPALGRPVGPHDPAVWTLVRQARPRGQPGHGVLAGRRHRFPGQHRLGAGPASSRARLPVRIPPRNL